MLIDGYFLGKPYGFGRFIGELCRALGRADSDLTFIVATPDRVPTDLLPAYSRLSWHRVPDTNFMVWEQITIPRLARTLRCGLIHFPYNTRALVPACPSVTTVHDLLFLADRVPITTLKDHVAARYAKLAFKTATRRAAAIVSVSRTTESALRHIGIQARTVYNTVDGFVAEFAPRRKPQPERPYILHRGGYAVHRNTQRVIEAFRRTRTKLGGIDLKIVGAPLGAGRWQVHEPEIQFLPRVSDRELAALYAGSSCVVAASLQEGFGLPIIEGFGFDAPVITAALDPMREIAGDAALLVDPYRIDAISDAMSALLCDPSLAMTLVERGRLRRKLFSSESVATQMIDVYAGLAG